MKPNNTSKLKKNSLVKVIPPRNPSIAQRNAMQLCLPDEKCFISIQTVLNREKGTAVLIVTNSNDIISESAGVLSNTRNPTTAQSVGVVAALMIARKRQKKELHITVEDNKVRSHLIRQLQKKDQHSGNLIFNSIKNLIMYFTLIICKRANRPLRQVLPISAQKTLMTWEQIGTL